MKLLQDTPIKDYNFQGKDFYVKREDLACLPPGPPFAKVRGLYPFLIKLRDQGIKIVSYLDTSISMASWGISYFSQQLGMKAVIYYPKYKDGILRHNQASQLKKWKEFGAEILPLENPNRLQINFYRARKMLLEKYPNAYMLPQGLPFEETKYEVAKQVELFRQEFGSVIICIGSGTMCSGLLMGLNRMMHKTDVYGITCAPKNLENMKKKILSSANLPTEKLRGFNLFKEKELKGQLFLYNSGYEYTEKPEIDCPFPTNRYYDAKAFEWMINNYEKLKRPILFWNIGSDFNQ